MVGLVWLGGFGLAGLVWQGWFGRFGLQNLHTFHILHILYILHILHILSNPRRENENDWMYGEARNGVSDEEPLLHCGK